MCLFHKLSLLIRSCSKKQSNDIKIACIMHGGIGDIINCAIYIKNFTDKLDCKYTISLATAQQPSIVQDLLYNQPFITKIVSCKKCKTWNYDLIVNFNTYIPIIVYTNKKVNKLSKFLPRFIKNLEDFRTQHNTLTTYDNTFCGQHYCLITDTNALTAMDIGNMLNLKSFNGTFLQVKGHAKTILQRYELNNAHFITIQRGINVKDKKNEDLRTWPIEHYNELTKLLKSRYPNIQIVQLGGSASKCISIDGVDINLVGKTTFGECMALLDASTLHIDCECGMTHVRHFLCKKPSVVLFGPTSPITKGHPENINLRSNVCNCELCEWLIGGNWQHKCIKTGTNFAPCMHAITPQMVMDAIKKHDGGKLDKLLLAVS